MTSELIGVQGLLVFVLLNLNWTGAELSKCVFQQKNQASKKYEDI